METVARAGGYPPVCMVVVVDGDPAACVLVTLTIWYCPFSVLTKRCPCCPVGIPWPGLSPCSVCSGTDNGVIIPGWFMRMFLPAGLLVPLGMFCGGRRNPLLRP